MTFGKLAAGLFYVGYSTTNYEWTLHFLVWPSFWQLGKQEDWYDGPLVSYGFGPFFLLAGMWKR